MSVTRLVVGLIAGVPLGLVGLVLGCLNLTGAMTLVVLGGLVFGGGGWTWGLLVAAVLAGRFGLALRGRISEKTPRNWLTVMTIWVSPTLAAIIYGAREYTAAWAAFIGATAFAAVDETMPTDTSSPAFNLVIGALTGVAMLVLHDLAAVRRGLPTGWIDLWLIPMGVVVASGSGAPVRKHQRGRCDSYHRSKRVATAGIDSLAVERNFRRSVGP